MSRIIMSQKLVCALFEARGIWRVTSSRKQYVGSFLILPSTGFLHSSPGLFSAYRGANDDVRVAVAYLRAARLGGGKAPIAAIGWSNSGTIKDTNE